LKVIQFINDCQISGGESPGLEFKGGLFYITSDDLCSKLKIILGENIGIEIPFSEIYNEYKGQDLNNKKLLALRHGGGGDILFMLTGLAELKRRYPSSNLNIAISPSYFSIPKNNPDINETISLPISLDEWNKYHYHEIFENLIENNPLAQKYNAYDLFLSQLKIDPTTVSPENKVPKLYLKGDEMLLALKEYPSLINKEIKRVGIQAEASSPIRKYIPYHFVKIGEELIKRGYEVYFFGSNMQRNTINYLTKQIGEGSYAVIGSMRQAFIVASRMDAFIAPDSMFVHVAGALGIPVIGIYGPFLSDLRMRYFKHSIGIDAKTNCSPCWKHGHNSCPKGEPSPCLKLITPEIVMNAFDELTKERES